MRFEMIHFLTFISLSLSFFFKRQLEAILKLWLAFVLHFYLPFVFNAEKTRMRVNACIKFEIWDRCKRISKKLVHVLSLNLALNVIIKEQQKLIIA